ncbi:hypothetical protein DW070_11680 [Coprococcus catus]|uniref:Uncharacterized protein n=1 Tax=Coprococcus catus TaxID=116085 RepID=A0A3E2TLI6_9FIRM|nr:hypothetical protein DW070_11680 [Coprococcus catus]
MFASKIGLIFTYIYVFYQILAGLTREILYFCKFIKWTVIYIFFWYNKNRKIIGLSEISFFYMNAPLE